MNIGTTSYATQGRRRVDVINLHRGYDLRDRKRPFQLMSAYGNTVNVYGGRFVFHNQGVYTIADTALTLTGSPCYIYAYHLRNHSSSGISFGNAYPSIDTTQLRYALFHFVSDDGGTTCRMADLGELYAGGDIHFDLPLA